MSMDWFIEMFHEHLLTIKEMIFSIIMRADEPDEEVLGIISEGLFVLADNGEKMAAGMYAAIAAYMHSPVYAHKVNFFSKEVGAVLLFAEDALKEYQQLIEEYFGNMNDEEVCEFFVSFPVTYFFKGLIDEHRNKSEE